jgi:hypothetical protein
MGWTSADVSSSGMVESLNSQSDWLTGPAVMLAKQDGVDDVFIYVLTSTSLLWRNANARYLYDRYVTSP